VSSMTNPPLKLTVRDSCRWRVPKELELVFCTGSPALGCFEMGMIQSRATSCGVALVTAAVPLRLGSGQYAPCPG
jgi:hypothetical protein